MLWRLYLLREWVTTDPHGAAREYAAGIGYTEPNHAVAGVEPPGPDEVRRVAEDEILHGVFDGDFAVALERAAAFCRVVSSGRADVTEGARAVIQAGRLQVMADDLTAGARLWRAGELGSRACLVPGGDGLSCPRRRAAVAPNQRFAATSGHAPGAPRPTFTLEGVCRAGPQGRDPDGHDPADPGGSSPQAPDARTSGVASGVGAMSMATVRQPAVSGRFYPGRPDDLRRDLDRLLAAARTSGVPGRPATGDDRPHAGYAYSTAPQPWAMSRWRPCTHPHQQGGPARPVPLRAVPRARAAHVRPFRDTPGRSAGSSPLTGCCACRRSSGGTRLRARALLEVQLPFLQKVLTFTLVPLVVGDATPEDVAQVIEACWGGPETLVLISSDLSHYRPYADARAMDADTVRRILALQWPLPERRACGAVGVNGMVVVARARGLRPVLVDARNSGDTAGDRARVVGYATVRFEEVRSDQG